MYILSLLYLLSFFASMHHLYKKYSDGILYFLIFGTAIYTTALSIISLYGFDNQIFILKSFKEICIISYMLLYINEAKNTIKLTLIDKLLLFFVGYNILYIFIPLGAYGIGEKILAFKTLCFFPFVYFTGRLVDPSKINLSKFFTFIFVLSITACAVLLVEFVTYTHLQTYTGYAAYMEKYFEQPPTGNFGLAWNFETEEGVKRFASFFSSPLELAAVNLITISALAAYITEKGNKIILNNISKITLISSVIIILFALSRASFGGYWLIIYLYAFLLEKKRVLKQFHFAVLAITLLFLFVNIKGDLADYFINTINFSNGSSAGHVIMWLEGINSIIKSPLGIGLGESGRISSFTGVNTGGENQFIILGVQTGIISLGIYITVMILFIKKAFHCARNSDGKLRKLGIFIFLIKLGLIIPLFTAELESYISVSYVSWFLSGIFISLESNFDFQMNHIANEED